MRKIYVFCLLGFFLFNGTVLASSKNDENIFTKLKQKIISITKEVLGSQKTETTDKESTLLEIKLPTIPKAQKDATSVANFENEKDLIKIPNDKKHQFDYLFVKEVFSVTRNRPPTDVEYGRWLNVLEQGGTREGVYRAIVLDQAYARLEGDRGYPINGEVNLFFIEYLKKYLDKKVSIKQTISWNIYTLKRIATEKTLEVLDLFPKDRDDIYDWYAIFSSDLATRWPKVWKGKIRQNTDPYVHKKWAKAVPNQHIKSEIIIKIHRLLNHLYATKPEAK